MSEENKMFETVIKIFATHGGKGESTAATVDLYSGEEVLISREVYWRKILAGEIFPGTNVKEARYGRFWAKAREIGLKIDVPPGTYSVKMNDRCRVVEIDDATDETGNPVLCPGSFLA